MVAPHVNNSTRAQPETNSAGSAFVGLRALPVLHQGRDALHNGPRRPDGWCRASGGGQRLRSRFSSTPLRRKRELVHAILLMTALLSQSSLSASSYVSPATNSWGLPPVLSSTEPPMRMRTLCATFFVPPVSTTVKMISLCWLGSLNCQVVPTRSFFTASPPPSSRRRRAWPCRWKAQ